MSFVGVAASSLPTLARFSGERGASCAQEPAKALRGGFVSGFAVVVNRESPPGVVGGSSSASSSRGAGYRNRPGDAGGSYMPSGALVAATPPAAPGEVTTVRTNETRFLLDRATFQFRVRTAVSA